MNGIGQIVDVRCYYFLPWRDRSQPTEYISMYIRVTICDDTDQSPQNKQKILNRRAHHSLLPHQEYSFLSSCWRLYTYTEEYQYQIPDDLFPQNDCDIGTHYSLRMLQWYL